MGIGHYHIYYFNSNRQFSFIIFSCKTFFLLASSSTVNFEIYLFDKVKTKIACSIHMPFPDASIVMAKLESRDKSYTLLFRIIFIVGLILLFTVRGVPLVICILLDIILIILGVLVHDEIVKVRGQLNENYQAQYYTDKLNEILVNSEEIVDQVLPYYENCVSKSLSAAKIDFNENAVIPFWEKIVEASKFLACFKEAVEQLIIYNKTYSQILINKSHNFPISFPIEINISVSEHIISNYENIVRQAHKHQNASFANVWMQMKTHEILIAGFETLENAIHRMRWDIVETINDLKNSIHANLTELKTIQNEQFKTFASSQAAINNTLLDMNDKLYYIQYKKQPRFPFHYK